MNTYDVNFFIDYFTAIPGKQWCVRSFCDPAGKRCAVGHFLRHEVPNHARLWEFKLCENTTAALLDDTKQKLTALADLFAVNGDRLKAQRTVYDINNGDHPDYRQRTPRARILAALYDVKARAEAALEAYELRDLKPTSKPEQKEELCEQQ